MAIYNYEGDSKSVNSYRAEIERVEKEKRTKEYLRELDKDTADVTKSAKKIVSREIRGAIMQDAIGHEAMNVYLLASASIGIAQIAIASASEARHENKIQELRDKVNEDYYSHKETPVENVDPSSLVDRSGGYMIAPTKSSEQFITTVQSTQRNLGVDLAITLGNAKESALVQRFVEDASNSAEAKRNNAIYNSTISNEERTQAREIIQKYSGDISSRDGIGKTIDDLKLAKSDLISKKEELTLSIEKNKSHIDSVDKKIVAAEKKLSAASGNSDELKQTINDLRTKKTDLEKNKEALNAKLNQTNKTLKGINSQIGFLSDNKVQKVLANTTKSGEGKKSAALEKRGSQRITKSIDAFGRSIGRSLHKGNLVHQDIKKTARSLSKAADKYDLALSVSKVTIKVMAFPASFAIKKIGKNTRLGQKISAKLGKPMQKIGKGVGKVLKAPGTLLRAPRKIMDAPKNMLKKTVKGAFRTTRKVVGKVGGGTVRIAKKGGKLVVKNTIGRTKFYQKMSVRFNRVTQRFNAFKNKISNFNPVKKLKKKIASIIASIVGAILSAVSAVFSFLLAIIGWLALIIFIVILAIAVLSLIMSIFVAIANWFKMQTTNEKSLVKNYPGYITQQAVNYRNYELDILELFNMASHDKSLIAVNSSPIYYSLYENTPSWGAKKNGIQLSAENTNANEVFNRLMNRLKARGTVSSTYKVGNMSISMQYVDNLFNSYIEEYDNIKLSYYSASQLATNSDGSYKTVARGDYETYVLKNNAVKAHYEISNAKDALALVDALFSEKGDRDEKAMQKCEVLAYLGVGDYQLGKKDAEDAAHTASTKLNNLFWNTHKFIYNSGDLSSDIWFHLTESPESDSESIKDKYNVTSYMYDETLGRNTWVGYCDNKEEITLKYYVDVTTSRPKHRSVNDFGTFGTANGGYGEYNASNAIKIKSSESSIGSGITASQLYYNLRAKDYYDASFPTINNQWIKNDETGVSFKQSFYFVNTNSSSSKNVVALHIDSRCDRLTFFRDVGNTYHVVDKNGNYMGKIVIDSLKNPELYSLVTKTNINGNVVNINTTSSGVINLDSFYIVWNNSDGAYEFKVISSSNAPNSYYINQTINYLKNCQLFKYDQAYLDTSSIKITCNHTVYSTEKEEDEVSFCICRGHIDLDVALVVTSFADGDLIFEEAAKVEGIENDMTNDSFLGIYSWSSENDVSGWGSSKTFAFKPYEDWAEGRGYIELAKAKMQNDMAYPLDGDDIKEFQILIKHYGGSEIKNESGGAATKPGGSSYLQGGTSASTGGGYAASGQQNNVATTFIKDKFSSAIESPDGNLLFGMMFNGQRYYVESFISGEQKELRYYLMREDGSLSPLGLLDINVGANNFIYVYEYAPQD